MSDYLHHRNVTSGVARAAVLAVSDGLLTNLSLILGVAGANLKPSLVALSGLSGLLAGSFSMAIGEFVSMTAQKELLENELKKEAREIRMNPEYEFQELVSLFESRGISRELAEKVSKELMADDKVALETHAREELGVDPAHLGAPFKAAVSSFVSFGIGALFPLAPWFFLAAKEAVLTSLLVSVLLAAFVGVLLAKFSERPSLLIIPRQIAYLIVAGSVTYLVGHVIGVNGIS